MGSIKREVEEFLNRVDKRGGIPYDLYSYLRKSTEVFWTRKLQDDLPP